MLTCLNDTIEIKGTTLRRTEKGKVTHGEEKEKGEKRGIQRKKKKNLRIEINRNK